MTLLYYAVLICSIDSVLAGITTRPGMQRKYLGETATFQWTVTGSFSGYSVYKLASGTLNANSNYTLDRQNGVVTLIIKSIELTDAGNYSLSISIGTTVQIDTGALLFVYGLPTISVNQTSGGSVQQPATEGDRVELTCTATSTSLPAEYRTKMYNQWQLSGIGVLQNISSGPARSANYGDLVDGYSIKDDGRTLVIASAQYRDAQGIGCYGQEQWSPYENDEWFTLPLKYRPYITYLNPASKKFNSIKNDSVLIRFYFNAVPAITSPTNWSFVNSSGYAHDLPVGSTSLNAHYSQFYLAFTLTSESYYGNYSVTLNNTVGSTTVTFQVLHPERPDTPSDVRAAFVSHHLIAIGWKCMWFNGRQQTTFLQLKAVYNNSIIDSSNTTLNTDCYESTHTTQFQNGIRPETEYEVRIWSTNGLGSSDVVKLTVKTPKIFRFFVSSNNISINGNQAIVNFSATESKIVRLAVTCCLELTGPCDDDYYTNVNSTTGQIIYSNMLSGNVYVFDFMVYGSDARRNAYYFLAMVRGVRVSRNREDEESDGGKANPLLIPVIVLGVLLGVAVLALIGCFIAYVLSKRLSNIQSNNSSQAQQPKTTTVTDTNAPQENAKQRNEAYEEDDMYEAIEKGPSKNDTFYTALEV